MNLLILVVISNLPNTHYCYYYYSLYFKFTANSGVIMAKGGWYILRTHNIRKTIFKAVGQQLNTSVQMLQKRDD